MFAFLVSLSAFFSGTELALMTLSAHRVESIAKTGGFSARILKRLKANPDRLLVTILIGNNLANVGASALATVSALTLAESLRLPGEYGIAIATGAVTFILLMFGEITPKSLAAKHAVSISLAVAPIYAVLVVLFLPISIVLEAFLWVVGRIFGTHRLSDVMTSEELEAFIDFSHKQGAVEDDERKQLKNLLDLAETEAEEAMTPRVRVNFAQLDMTVDEVCDLFLRLPHSRLPVYGRSHDDVDYVVTMRVAFAHRWAGRGTSKLRDLKLEKIIKAPITQPLDTILETFQKSRKHIALLLDEHGGVAGIITLEDVIEEVFGEIQDETDREVREIRTLSDGSL
ncbi:MAG TPA: CNNM domain-containing protein [bacterium]|nr:CNNM domain-containing protein [bacterium]